MPKARFKTKLSKKQKKNNVIVFLAVALCLYAFTLWFSFSIGIFDDWTDPDVYTIGAALTLAISSMLMFPIILAAIVLGAQKGRAKRVRDNTTFIPVQNIDYYREKLSELNPSIVSLLIDLDIDGPKVIVATLLRMQNKKIIQFEKNNKISVNSENTQRLDPCEEDLLCLIMHQNGKVNNKTLMKQWKEDCFLEAESRGYIQKKVIKNEEKIINRYAYLLIVSTLAAFMLLGAFLEGSVYEDIDSMAGIIKVAAILLTIDVMAFVPPYLCMQKSTYKKRGDVLWERTPLGNETAEKIAGLGRFINEFSRLSEAKREQAGLWEDYLVYAIVLEENEQIVKDISKQYKADLIGF